MVCEGGRGLFEECMLACGGRRPGFGGRVWYQKTQGAIEKR